MQTQQFQYHVLSKGFPLQQRKGEDYETTDLRHYRLLIPEYKYESKEGKDVFTNTKTGQLFGSFPSVSTLVLVEPVRERE